MTRKQLWAFLGLTGYFRIWIPNYGLIAQPLYESLRGWDDSIPLMWETLQKKAEVTLKQALTQASALRLPYPEKNIPILCPRKRRNSLGSVNSKVGTWAQPVIYSSKRLNPPAQGWPPCLRNLATVVMLIEDALKLFSGGKLFLPATKWNNS